ncbi:hypothetical protein N9O57_01085 [bacterium]|nr:hypothetical protein [bacterium]
MKIKLITFIVTLSFMSFLVAGDTSPEFEKLEDKIEAYSEKLIADLESINDLKTLREKIISENYSGKKVNSNLDFFAQSLVQHSSELKNVTLSLDSSIANWKTGGKGLKFYPYKIKAKANVDFQNKLGYQDFGIYGVELSGGFSSAFSIKALDNLGFKLLAGNIEGTVKLDSLKVLHRILANPDLKKACSDESLEALFNDLAQVEDDAGSNEEEKFSVDQLKEIITLVCSISHDVTEATEFNSLVKVLSPKFLRLEKEMGAALKGASKELGEDLASAFNFPKDSFISKASAFAFKHGINFLTEYKLKANDCSQFIKNPFKKCVPKITVELGAQPIFGETKVSFVLSKERARIDWGGEVVPYAVNWLSEDSKKDMYIYTYVVMKTIESLSESEMKLLGKFCAREFTEISKELAELLVPQDDIKKPGDVTDFDF